MCRSLVEGSVRGLEPAKFPWCGRRPLLDHARASRLAGQLPV
jgi:hypothetical protein